jgi:hypothetical protein
MRGGSDMAEPFGSSLLAAVETLIKDQQQKNKAPKAGSKRLLGEDTLAATRSALQTYPDKEPAD